MSINRRLKVPTGDILIIDGDYGKIECLSLGDYGKESNVKADFLDLKRDINGVPDGECMPLEKKWVVTISTQYGCSMGCKFCDVPKVGSGRNVTLNDLQSQIEESLRLHMDVLHTDRLNVHYARMGEPTFNPFVLTHARGLKQDIVKFLGNSLIHPVVSTMLPKNNKNLQRFLYEWCYIKNNIYDGDAGLQFSINTTDDEQRSYLFNDNSLTLEQISFICGVLPMPKGRKYALNIALSDDTIIDANRMVNMFSPDKFMVKITPIHVTNSCIDNNIQTSDGYDNYTPYKTVEADLKSVGFDVLVFVPSEEEDKGRITCGNAILSGTLPECNYKEVSLK